MRAAGAGNKAGLSGHPPHPSYGSVAPAGQYDGAVEVPGCLTRC